MVLRVSKTNLRTRLRSERRLGKTLPIWNPSFDAEDQVKMMKHLFLIAILFIACSATAQTPGGVAANPQAWFKSNVGVLTTVSSMNVESWADQSIFGNNAIPTNVGTSPVFSTQPADLINYNPVVNFVATNGHELPIPSNLNIAKSSNQPYSLFGVSRYLSGQMPYIGTQATGTGRPPFSAFQFGIRGSANPDLAVWRYDNTSHHLVGSGNYPSQGNQTVAIGSAVRAGITTSGYINGEFGNSTTTNAYFANNPLRLGAGGGGPSGNVFSTQNMAEIIVFDVTLSPVDLSKVNSYLAVKYGLTLSNTGGGVAGDYLAPDGTLIWDASLSPNYHNDIIGIGRSDTTCLLQKQSHTIDDTTKIYLSSLAATNALNPTAITSNTSYILAGHDNGMLCATPASFQELPTGLVNCTLFSRLEREWKITNTNFGQTYHCDITLNNCAIPNQVSIADLRLLVDDDGDFSNGGTACYFMGDGSGISFSYSNPILSIENIGISHIGLNQTRYITIASVTDNTPLPSAMVSFEANPLGNREVELNWQTGPDFDLPHISISKSVDQVNWENVIRVEAGADESQSFLDNRPYSGLSYYKLTALDVNGNASSAIVRSVMVEREGLVFWPNPSHAIVEIMGEPEQLQNLSLYDYTGKRLTIQFLSPAEGKVTVDVSNLPAGVYILKSFDKAYRLLKE